MKNWICKKCGLYKVVCVDDIKVGCEVYFYEKCLIKKKFDFKLFVGCVLSISNDFCLIAVDKRVVTVNVNMIYPVQAPALLVYKIFGECYC